MHRGVTLGQSFELAHRERHVPSKQPSTVLVHGLFALHALGAYTPASPPIPDSGCRSHHPSGEQYAVAQSWLRVQG